MFFLNIGNEEDRLYTGQLHSQDSILHVLAYRNPEMLYLIGNCFKLLDNFANLENSYSLKQSSEWERLAGENWNIDDDIKICPSPDNNYRSR